jgi:hypothetical protein
LADFTTTTPELKFSVHTGLRKVALTAHVTFSVGLLGSIAAFLVLAVAGLTSQDAQMVRAAYLAMELIARFVVVPFAFVSLLTGLIQSPGTPWGLFRHYWVVVKLLLTVFAIVVLLVKMELIGYAARLAAETTLSRADLRAAGIQLVVHAAGGLLVLLVPAVLSLYKPPGVTGTDGEGSMTRKRCRSRSADSMTQGRRALPKFMTFEVLLQAVNDRPRTNTPPSPGGYLRKQHAS